MCQEGTFLWPDEDVGSSEWRVYVMAWLIRDDRLLISIKNSFFSESPFGKSSKLKHAQLGVISGWVTDREVASECTRVMTKCAGKTSIELWGQSRSCQE